MGSHDALPDVIRKAYENAPEELVFTELPAVEPVLLHGHTHQPIDGFSTVEELEEKMASLEGKQLTADSYGTGRVPSLQDSPFSFPIVDYLKLLNDQDSANRKDPR